MSVKEVSTAWALNAAQVRYTAILRKVVRKVHATIPKGIVGGFEFTVVQRNLKEWHERPWTCV